MVPPGFFVSASIVLLFHPSCPIAVSRGCDQPEQIRNTAAKLKKKKGGGVNPICLFVPIWKNIRVVLETKESKHSYLGEHRKRGCYYNE